jgi:glucans biosynthesis protein
MDRRTFLLAGCSALGLLRSPGSSSAASGRELHSGSTFKPTPTANYVRRLARKLAKRRYDAPADIPARGLAELDYDGYRQIRFRSDKAIWRKEELGFELQLFPCAYLYRTPIEIFLVDGHEVRRLNGDPALFDFGDSKQPVHRSRVGLSGFRIHAPLNRRDFYDEFMVFQGASYFRGLGKAHRYGLSARALALNTAGPDAEEFPIFRSFWIERPETPEAITVHGLLDSPSVTGAYTFVVKPGRETLMETEAVLFPRRDLANVGIAPLTSMFLKTTHDPDGPQDFRPSVHDSDGLAVWTGTDEQLWRPLRSPPAFHASYFGDRDPKGFGLVQRERAFEDYQDLEATYEQRPSAWVAPKGSWGTGSVELVEIPTDVEYVDNIVACWRPAQPLAAGGTYSFAYQIAWCDEAPARNLARVHKTRTGLGTRPGTLRFVVDFKDPSRSIEKVAGSNAIVLDAPPVPNIAAALGASAGSVTPPVVQRNPHLAGTRVTFELDPGDAKDIELRLALTSDGEPASETWLYRWSA